MNLCKMAMQDNNVLVPVAVPGYTWVDLISW